MRWTGALLVLSLVSGLMSAGVIPVEAVGLARIMFTIFATLLGLTLTARLITGR